MSKWKLSTLVLLFYTASAVALPTKPVLTLDVAKKMADACEAKAKKAGWKLSIAIVDDGGHLILFRRMYGSVLLSEPTAIDKAKTAVYWPIPTSRVATIVYGKDKKWGSLPGLANINNLTAYPGGLPIQVGDVTIGAIGAGGERADLDEQCAQVGIDAVADELKS